MYLAQNSVPLLRNDLLNWCWFAVCIMLKLSLIIREGRKSVSGLGSNVSHHECGSCGLTLKMLWQNHKQCISTPLDVTHQRNPSAFCRLNNVGTPGASAHYTWAITCPPEHVENSCGITFLFHPRMIIGWWESLQTSQQPLLQSFTWLLCMQLSDSVSYTSWK